MRRESVLWCGIDCLSPSVGCGTSRQENKVINELQAAMPSVDLKQLAVLTSAEKR